MTTDFDRTSLVAGEPVFVHRCLARFQDVDAAGFVFFARTFDYFHDAWLAFMEAGGMPHADVLRAKVWGVPLRRAEADFLAPMRFGDALEVGLVRAAWNRSDFTIGYRVSIVGKAVAAVGATHHVTVDMSTFKRTDPPKELVALLRPLTGP